MTTSIPGTWRWTWWIWTWWFRHCWRRHGPWILTWFPDRGIGGPENPAHAEAAGLIGLAAGNAGSDALGVKATTMGKHPWGSCLIRANSFLRLWTSFMIGHMSITVAFWSCTGIDEDCRINVTWCCRSRICWVNPLCPLRWRSIVHQTDDLLFQEAHALCHLPSSSGVEIPDIHHEPFGLGLLAGLPLTPSDALHSTHSYKPVPLLQLIGPGLVLLLHVT